MPATLPPPVSPAAVVSNLRQHLALDSLPLATTAGGRAFAIKALHPSDAEISAARAPCGSMPTALFYVDQTFDVPVFGTTTVHLHSDPVAPVVVINQNSGGNVYSFLNPTLGGTVVQSPTSHDYNVCARQLATLAEA